MIGNLIQKAKAIAFNNKNTGLEATNVQDALIKVKTVQTISSTLNSVSSSMGGCSGLIDISDLLPNNVVAIIPFTCHQTTDNNRIGVLSKVNNDMTNGAYRINGTMAAEYLCVFKVLYTG